LNLKSKKKRKFKKWYTRVDWKAETKNHDMEYLSDKKLLKKFIGTKIEISNIYRNKNYLIVIIFLSYFKRKKKDYKEACHVKYMYNCTTIYKFSISRLWFINIKFLDMDLMRRLVFFNYGFFARAAC
jgi:hypothetical protein